MEVTWYHDCGLCTKLQIDVRELLIQANLRSINKIFDIVRESGNLVAMKQFESAVEGRKDELPVLMKQCANVCVDNGGRIKEVEARIDKLKRERRGMSRGCRMYKKLSGDIKILENQLSVMKKTFRLSKSDFRQYSAEKEKLEKLKL